MVLGDRLRVLINAIGISDSGGIVVLEKLLNELLIDNADHTFLFFISKNIQTKELVQNELRASSLSRDERKRLNSLAAALITQSNTETQS